MASAATSGGSRTRRTGKSAPAAIGTPSPLNTSEKKRFERIRAKVAREIWIAASTSASAFRTRTTSAASTARLVPQPMATPTSAWASAGPSFTPSPTIMTTRPSPCSRATTAALPSGRTRANASGMPHFLATAAAHRSVSPVSM